MQLDREDRLDYEQERRAYEQQWFESKQVYLDRVDKGVKRAQVAGNRGKLANEAELKMTTSLNRWPIYRGPNSLPHASCYISTLHSCPASPERRRPSASSRTHSDGPVSQTLLTSDFKRRELLRAFATLDDSQTPMKNW